MEQTMMGGLLRGKECTGVQLRLNPRNDNGSLISVSHVDVRVNCGGWAMNYNLCSLFPHITLYVSPLPIFDHTSLTCNQWIGPTFTTS